MTPPVPPPGFTGSPLDRMDAVRSDAAAIAALRADRAAGLLVLTATGEPEIADGRLVWGAVPAEGDLALLGTIAGRPLFAAIPSPAPGLRGRPR